MNAKRRVKKATGFLVVGLALAASAAFGAPDAAQRTAEKPTVIVATDYEDIHAAVAAAKELDVYRIYVPSGIYVLDKTLDLTRFTWSPIYRDKPDGGREMIPRNRTVVFEGAGMSTIFIAKTGDTPAFDLSGCQAQMILRDFVVQTPYEMESPKGPHWIEGSSVGIFMARLRLAKGGRPSSGGHVFENVRVHGAYKTAAVVCWDSETDRFYNCRFRNTLGDGFILTNRNKEGVKSPYVRNGDSTSTECRFYGTSFGVEGKGAVGLRVSGFHDVSLHGGYVSTRGDKDNGPFAGIYLDGTGKLRNFTCRDFRMECSVGHCVYAVGAVSNVLLEGGEWISMNVENIRHEDKIPNRAGPHRFVETPQGSGSAQNWVVRGLRFSRSFEADPKLAQDKRVAQAETLLRFDSLLDSRFQNCNFYSRYPNEKGADWGGRPDAESPRLIVDNYSRRNYFEFPSRKAVRLTGDAKSNQIVALCDGADNPVPALWRTAEARGLKKRSALYRSYDGGARRTYVKPDDGVSLLNLGRCDVFAIPAPQDGDFAMHDGSGFADGKPRLAVYDGKAGTWLFFGLDQAPEPKR